MSLPCRGERELEGICDRPRLGSLSICEEGTCGWGAHPHTSCISAGTLAMYPIGVGNKEERGRGRWLPDAAGKGAHLDIVCLRASFRMTGPVLGCWVAVVISLFVLLCMPTSLDEGARVEVG